MVSNVVLHREDTGGGNDSYINGWIVEDSKISIQSSPDSMPMPLTDSSETFLMDYGGRERIIVIRGVLKQGATLGTGIGMTVTNLGDQWTAIDTYFINLLPPDDTTAHTFTLSITGGDSVTRSFEGISSNFDITVRNPVYYEFTLRFMEGNKT